MNSQRLCSSISRDCNRAHSSALSIRRHISGEVGTLNFNPSGIIQYVGLNGIRRNVNVTPDPFAFQTKDIESYTKTAKGCLMVRVSNFFDDGRMGSRPNEPVSTYEQDVGRK